MAWARNAIAWLAVAMLVSMVTDSTLVHAIAIACRVHAQAGCRGRRRLLDLHNLFAVYLYVPLFILAFTACISSSRMD